MFVCITLPHIAIVIMELSEIKDCIVYLGPGILSQTILCLFTILPEIVNKQRIVCDRIPGSRYSIINYSYLVVITGKSRNHKYYEGWC